MKEVLGGLEGRRRGGREEEYSGDGRDGEIPLDSRIIVKVIELCLNSLRMDD